MNRFSGCIKRNWERIKSCGTILTDLIVVVRPEGEARHLVTCKSSLKFSLAASGVLYMQFMWWTCKWNVKAYADLSHITLFPYEAVSFSFRKKNLGYNCQFKLESQRLSVVIIQFNTRKAIYNLLSIKKIERKWRGKKKKGEIPTSLRKICLRNALHLWW